MKTEGFKGAPNKSKPRRNYAEKKRLSVNILNSTFAVIAKSPVSDRPDLQSAELQAGPKCYEAWETLKDKLCNTSILAFPNFNRPFIFYTDGNKEKGFGAALHQIDSNGIKRPILFLSRDLTDIETRYWAIELEVGALVWALIKLPQFFDDEKFTVVIDHIALKSALQNKTNNRRFIRFNEWALYLFTFQSRMKIIHRAGKSHDNVDGLSRLPITDTKLVHVLSIMVIRAEEELLKNIATALPKDFHFDKIYEQIQKQVKNSQSSKSSPHTIYQSYRLNVNFELLYILNSPNLDRLCISGKFTRRILEYEHDSHAYEEIHRTYDRLRDSIYFPKMRQVIQSYIDDYPTYQLSKPSRQLSYGQLHSVGKAQ